MGKTGVWEKGGDSSKGSCSGALARLSQLVLAPLMGARGGWVLPRMGAVSGLWMLPFEFLFLQCISMLFLALLCLPGPC